MSFAMRHFARAARVASNAPLELAVADDGSESAQRLQSIYARFGFVRIAGEHASYPPFAPEEAKTYMRAPSGIRDAVVG